jgi:hypothetical protein
MTRATRDRAPPHARIHSRWLDLPTWQALSPDARALLVEIMGRYRPGENGRLSWPVRRAAEVLGVSKTTAARALLELERNGWLAVTRNARFSGKARPALYGLAMFPEDSSGQPASNAFEVRSGERLRAPRKSGKQRVSRQRDSPVPPKGLNGPPGGTKQSAGEDKPVLRPVPSNLSAAPASRERQSQFGKRG